MPHPDELQALQPEHSQAVEQDKSMKDRIALQTELQELQRKVMSIAPSGNVRFFTEFDCVRQFHACMGTNGTLRLSPSKEAIERRIRIVAEEVKEFMDDMEKLKDGTIGPSIENMARLLDHCVDIAYVVMGTCAEFGLPFDSGFEVVHLANMHKFDKGVKKNEYGKLIKPEGWQPPDRALWQVVFDAHKHATMNDDLRKGEARAANLEEVPGNASLMQEAK